MKGKLYRPRETAKGRHIFEHAAKSLNNKRKVQLQTIGTEISGYRVIATVTTRPFSV